MLDIRVRKTRLSAKVTLSSVGLLVVNFLFWLLSPYTAQAGSLTTLVEETGKIQFESSFYTVTENVGSAVFTVTRNGGSAGSIAANVSLTDLTSSPADYSLPKPASLDTTFDIGSGANSSVKVVALQPDGKVVLGGSFTLFNGASFKRIVRLNTNGQVDNSFVVGTGASGVVETVTVQPDGKILLGGSFASYDGNPSSHIARLNPDGSLDNSFNVGAGADDNVYAVALQPDGKILIGGNFTSYAGTNINRIARLNPDGSLDSTFNVGTGADDIVYSLALQPDGKVLLGGQFTTYAGTDRKALARLNANGSLDNSFTVGDGANGLIQTLVVQPDGKILIGGQFTSYSSVTQNYITRLNSDGTLDSSFESGTGPNDWVNTLTLQADGKILLGGGFTEYNGVVGNYIARLHSNGTLDSEFNPDKGPDNWINSIALQANGKILAGGFFTKYNDIGRGRLARLNNDIMLTWADGDATSRTFVLPVINDSLTEPNEKLTLTLSSTLAILGSPISTTLTILDNDFIQNQPATISPTIGSEQTAALNATFSLLLAANVYDQLGNPVAGQIVTFTAPSGGASGSFSGGNNFFTATTGSNGRASSSAFTANSQAGVYTVTASVAGVITPANFVLTNCDPLRVVSVSAEANCGTLPYALNIVSPGLTISLTLAAGSTIELSSGITLPQGAKLVAEAACQADAPPVTLLYTGSNLENGLTLAGNNSVYGLWIRGFSDKQLVAYSGGNNLHCVKTSKT